MVCRMVTWLITSHEREHDPIHLRLDRMISQSQWYNLQQWDRTDTALVHSTDCRPILVTNLVTCTFCILVLWFYAYVLRPPISVSIPGSACASVYCYFVLFSLLLYATVCKLYIYKIVIITLQACDEITGHH